MLHKILALIVCFYILAAIQASFLPHFSIIGVTPNLVLIGVFLVAFFEKSSSYSGIFGALSAGMSLDLLGNSFIGSSVIVYLAIYFLLKEVLKQLPDMPRKYYLMYFLPILAVSVIFCDFLLGVFYYFNHKEIFLNFIGVGILVKIIYTVLIGAAGFYIFNALQQKKK